MNPVKICPSCNNELSSNMFVDFQGNKNPKGKYCIDCRERKDQESREISFNGRLSGEMEYIKKYKIMYGDDWKTKAAPNAFLLILFMERDFCLYCGKSFREDQIRKEISEKYHIDHMNPLNIGGEDSILNAVCVCKSCNLKKGNKKFSLWLEKLSPKYQIIAEKVYIEKLGYSPVEFIPSEPTSRTSGVRYELSLDIEDLLKMKEAGEIY
jgi:hypothetical protein